MNDFVGKPVDPADLYGALLRWLPAQSPAPVDTCVTEPSDNTVWERIGAVPGLEPQCGAAMRLGADVYLRLLRLFARQHASDAQRARESLAAGDLGEVQRLAHVLKGAAGSLGATEVAEAATALGDKLRSGRDKNELDRCAARLETALAVALEGIGKELAEVTPTVEPGSRPLGTDRVQLSVLLARLKTLLKTGDMAAGALARAEQQLLHAGLGDASEALLALIERFDYEGALELVEEASQRAVRPDPTGEHLGPEQTG